MKFVEFFDLKSISEEENEILIAQLFDLGLIALKMLNTI